MIEKIANDLKDIFEKKKEKIKIIDDVEGIGVLKRENFREFKRIEFNKACYAVDGGSAIILDGGSWILSKIRVGYVKIEKNRTREVFAKEFYHLFVLLEDGYISKLYKMDKNDLNEVNIDQPDFSRRLKGENAIIRNEILQIPSHLMKHLEYSLLEELVYKIAKEGDLILEDSLLYTPFEKGLTILKSIYQNCLDKGISLVGISKTTRLRTDFGRSLGLVFEEGEKLFKGKLWYYYPLLSERKMKIVGEDLIAKLHEDSDRCFRLNICAKDIEKVLGYIAYFCKDPELLGYPYPLMLIDRIIRITNKERENESMNAYFVFKKLGIDSIIKDIKSQDFHSELDKRAHK